MMLSKVCLSVAAVVLLGTGMASVTAQNATNPSTSLLDQRSVPDLKSIVTVGVWTWERPGADHEFITFKPNGTAKHPKFESRWRVSAPGAIRLTTAGGKKTTLTFNADATAFEGQDFEGRPLKGKKYKE